MANITSAAANTLSAATNLAKENSNSVVAPIHLFSALLSPSSASEERVTKGNSLLYSILENAGGNLTSIQKEVEKAIVRLPVQDPPPENPEMSNNLKRVIQQATKQMETMNDSYLAQDHLIVAVCEDAAITPILAAGSVTVDLVKKAAHKIRGGKQVNSSNAEESFEALSKYAKDLTAEAESGKLDPVIGRDFEIRRCIRILSRRTKNNPVLIGEPGVGKTAIAEGLAQRIVARDVPSSLVGRLYSLDLGALHAGASYKGQFEERVKSVLEECEKSENVILFIDEIHTIMAGRGSSNSGIDAANLLKPALARGKIRCIGATTLAEYREYIEKDAAFERRFQQVLVPEPTVAQTISILRGIKERYEVHHGVSIQDAALVAAATLAERYLTSRRLPDSAIDCVDEACSAVRVARDSQPEEVDKLEREKLQLEIEKHALESEYKKNKKDEAAKQKIEECKANIARIDEQLAPLKAQYEAEKAKGQEIADVKRRIDELTAKAADAERRYDLALAADLKHFALPDLHSKLESLEAQKLRDDATGDKMAGDVVTPEAIQAVVSGWSGIPVQSLKTTEREKLLKMERILSKQVVGQPEAVKAVADAIRMSRSGLSNASRPLASFLFVGPSGTGKTLLTKTLAQFLFDSPEAICRIDGSEYSEKHSVSRLIGAPPGYIGHDQGGVLTEFIRRKPFSIVLIDELEKASREFHQLFLQVLDDGRLTDSKGTVVSFKNTVIIMTSNLGSQYLNNLPADDPVIPSATRDLVDGAIRAVLPPEFINRIDSIIVFNRLSKNEVRNIVDIRIQEVQKRLRVNGRDVTLNVERPALDFLGEIGYSPTYGARPLARAIQNQLLHPLSKLLIEDRIRDGEVANIVYDPKANRLVIVPNHEGTAPPENDYDSEGEDDVDVEMLD